MFRKTLLATLIGIPLLISSGCERIDTVYQGKFKKYDIQIRDVFYNDGIWRNKKMKRVVSFREKDKLFHLVDRKGDGTIDSIYEGKFDPEYSGKELNGKDPLRKTLLKEADKTYQEILEYAAKDRFK